MIFRFKVDDKVHLRSDLKELNQFDYEGELVDSMKKYAGKIVTIKDVCERHGKPCYYIRENGFLWDERLFEGGKESFSYIVARNKPTIKYNIKKVIFNNPATIVLWQDGTKTVVKRQKGDRYDKEKGLAMCIAKKALGNKGNYCNVFKEWL